MKNKKMQEVLLIVNTLGLDFNEIVAWLREHGAVEIIHQRYEFVVVKFADKAPLSSEIPFNVVSVRLQPRY